MSGIPSAKGFDSTLALLRNPYGFISETCRDLDSDLFETRVLFQKTICMTGAAAAEVFYSEDGCCQTKANRSLLTAARLRSGGKLPPFGQRGLPVLLEPVAGIEVSVEIEVVVDGRVDGGEFLKTSHLPEAEHRPLSSSQW
jgi:hypothetical protein